MVEILELRLEGRGLGADGVGEVLDCVWVCCGLVGLAEGVGGVRSPLGYRQVWSLVVHSSQHDPERLGGQ